MSDLHLRPRGVTELVDAAFTLYRRHPVQYFAVAAVAMSPAIALSILMPVPTTTTEVTLSAGITQIISWLGNALVGAVVTRAGSDAYLTGELDVAAALRDVIRRVPAVLVATVLRGFAYGIGALFFLVGAAYAAARWFAVGSVVVLEGKGPLEAFERSTDLSDENKMHILKTLGLVWVIYFIVVVGGAIAFAWTPGLVQQVLMGVISIVAYPVVALTGMVLYYDARIRNEGFDVEHMTRTLDPFAAERP
jgi:hypothetical protein